MTVQIIRGNALHLPLADESVDLVCTSPPYFGLRSYQDGGQHYEGQLGSEATPAEFVDALLQATREMVRVTKPSGSIWVNLGDKYAGGGGGVGSSDGYTARGSRPPRFEVGIPSKSLMGIPWRYALACIDQLGLILRAEIIWNKPNGLPESVTDRVRRSHEQWFWFQQSGGVEVATEGLPFCPQCGRPVDARTSLISRLQELDGSVESLDLPDHVGPDQAVQDQGASHTDAQVRTVPDGSGVPLLVHGDTDVNQNAPDLFEDAVVSVVNHDSQVGIAAGSMAQPDSAFAVDNASEPREVCRCVRHPLIIDDEPWIPQSLVADILQGVADGEIDPQQASDFLSGDYVRTHSVWFHLVKQPRYYSAVDEIREGYAPATFSRNQYGRPVNGHPSGDHTGPLRSDRGVMDTNPLGKLPGSVWTVPTEPLTVPAELGVDHFAAFPIEWPRRIILGWTPPGICVACGQGRRPVVSSVGLNMDRPQARRAHDLAERNGLTEDHFAALLSVGVSDTGRGAATQTGTGKNTPEVYALADQARSALGGYAREYLLRRPTGFGYACGCPTPNAPTRPSTVLDPFGGTGTTALVADVLGRHAIHIDLSADYNRLARWRINNPDQRAKAARVDKPPPVTDGQLTLGDL